jgi:hypothetical protein
MWQVSIKRMVNATENSQKDPFELWSKPVPDRSEFSKGETVRKGCLMNPHEFAIAV